MDDLTSQRRPSQLHQSSMPELPHRQNTLRMETLPHLSDNSLTCPRRAAVAESALMLISEDGMLHVWLTAQTRQRPPFM